MLQKKRFWFLAMLISLILVLAACGGDDDNASKESNGDGDSNTTENVNNNEEEEDLELVTFHYFNGFSPGEDKNTSETRLGKMFEEATGVNFDIEYIVGDVNTKVGTFIASGDYPHLMNAEQSTDQVISAGGFRPLNDLIEEHAPNIKALFEPYWELMKHDDGNIYVLPHGAAHGYAREPNTNQGAYWVQRRVLKEFDYPELKTLDDLVELIEAYVEKYPEVDGKETIGFTGLTYDWRFFAFSNQPMHLAGYPNDGEVLVDMDTYEVEVYSDKEITKRFLKTMNYLYNKGLFDPETFVQNYDEYLAKIASGRVVAFFDYGWQVGDAFNNIRNSGDYYSEYMGFPLVFEEGIKDQYLDPEGFVARPGIGITVSATDEEAVRIIKYLDHLAKEENNILVTWGIEGETYTVLEDGTFTRTPEQIELTEDEDFRDEFGFSTFEWNWLRRTGMLSDGINPVEPPNSPEIAQLTYDNYPVDREFLDAYGLEVFTDLFSDPDPRPWFPAWDTHIEQGSAAQIYEQQADDLRKSAYPKIVMAPEDQFEAEWDAFVEEFRKLDYEAYEEVLEANVKRVAELMGMD